MFVVFGNHEFDEESCERESVLRRRVAESDFYWLHSNISLTPCAGSARPRLAGANLVQTRIVQVGRLKVGLFGLSTRLAKTGLGLDYLDPLETARTLVTDLRRRGADVVVAVTHLPWGEDLARAAGCR